MFIDKVSNILSDFESEEARLIEDFRMHPVLSKIHQVSEENFLIILIQRMFVSLAITPVYEFAINSISDENIVFTIREILYEEYPRDAHNNPLPSHRELLMADLISLGASRDFIHSQSIFYNTRDSICSALEMLYNRDQIGIIAFVRFWGEVLVSEEYSCLWRKMQEKLSANGEDGKKRSLFYWFHMKHDEKKRSLSNNDILESYSHSEMLAEHLKSMIKSEDDMKYCIEIEKEAQKMKLGFYDQFEHLVKTI
jgi:hypothetical protein